MINVIKPSVKIESITPDAYEMIEAAGRTAYKSQSKGDAAGFVEMIVNRGHLSVIEHASATVRFICSRGCSHEMVRHRLGSFTQESTRYCDYAGGLQVILPQDMDKRMLGDWGTGAARRKEIDLSHEEFFWLQTVTQCATSYAKSNRPPQMKRGRLPIDVKTEVVMTANFREWLHVFNLRCAEAAHPEIRKLMKGVQCVFSEKYPEIFKNIPSPVTSEAEK